jgi:pyruvate/2-oxoglutarate/acetoin dehydrogenase E1 component
MSRRLTYVQALNEALHQAMEHDPRVFVIGQGVKNPWYVGQSMVGLYDRFGGGRVIDPPVSEEAMNGFGVGAALAGDRPVVLHPRLDFLLMGLEQLVNQASNWSYMFDGQQGVPLTIWGIINRGGEQAAQHSQAIQAMLAHVPGLKVVMPATAYDVKGLMLAAIEDPNPVVVIDERWIYAREDEVPEAPYTIPIGQAHIARPGRDVTIVGTSHAFHLGMEAAEALGAEGIDAEVINLRSIAPWDADTVVASVQRTGRLVVVDAAWRSFGITAEIAATVGERAFGALRAPIERVALPDVPAPMSASLEQAYYLKTDDIVAAVRRACAPAVGMSKG